MFLARVQGHVVASTKDPAIHGQRLLLVEPLRIDYARPETAGSAGARGGGGTLEVTGRAIVAIDTLGAGEGELVLIVQGSSARMARGMNEVPLDAAVIGIVDKASVLGGEVR